MRAHNYYAAPGFERAGLRRRDSGWIVERIADPASLFVPVWRNQNLIIEIDGGEPRAVVLGWGGLVPLIGDGGAAEERLARGEIVFIGVVEERAHFALDLSPIEAPLDRLRSIHEGARDMARDIAGTEAYATSRRERKKIEMLFAHLKRVLKLDRLRLRGPNGARDEFHLAATAQNLRKLAMLIPLPAPTSAS
jgi:hypothetical protein